METPAPSPQPPPAPSQIPKPSPAPIATVRPAGPEAPKGWNVIRFAISPNGRGLKVLQKHQHEGTEDPEDLVRQWYDAWRRDPNSSIVEEKAFPKKDGEMIYYVALLRAGKIISSSIGHATMHSVFTEAGAFDGIGRLMILVNDNIVRPLSDDLQSFFLEHFPDARQRRQLAEDVQQALPAPAAPPTA